jgi:hypothetical protein
MRQSQGCAGWALLAAGAAWVALVMLLGQAGVWLGEQLALLGGAAPGGWAGPIGSLAMAGLIALPLGGLAALVQEPASRAVLRSWLLACGLAAALALLRALPPSWSHTALLAQAAICLALAALAGRAAHGGGRRPPTDDRRPPTADRRPTTAAGTDVVGGGTPPLYRGAVACAVGVATALPWLRLGALGSPLDTALAALAGVSFALLAGLALDRALFRPLDAAGLAPGAAGFGAAVALLIAAGGLGASGIQLPLMLSLPPLGIAAAALARAGGWRPVAALLAPATAAPLALVDPDEISLLLLPGDVPQVALGAAFQALLLGLTLGGLLLALARRQPYGHGGAEPADQARPALPLRLHGATATATLALALGLGAVAYAGGQPGFHGDRLFVILHEQADLRGIPQVGGRDERIRAVYEALTRHATRSQAGLRAELGRRGVAYTPYYLMNAIEVHTDDPWLRADLAARPEVDRVLDSPLLRPLPTPAAADPGDAPAPDEPPWNITSIGADRAWRELDVTGAGMVIGQLDSGVDGGHPALRDGYRGRGAGDDYHWLDPWSGAPAPVDHGGHGTYTLGSALGRGGIGVAPGAEWIGCVVLERNLGSPPRYLDCLQFMLAPFPRGGDPFRDGDPARAPHILNNSWGCPPVEGCDAEALRPAAEALRAAGIFVAAAVGNDGPGCSSAAAPIGIYDAVFAVGAVDASGAVPPFSSRGPVMADGSGRAKPDIAAPGVAVLSTWPGGGYYESSGTSAATPHVAGVVALMWSADAALIGDLERTERILAETARPPGATPVACGGSGNSYGAGIVDAYAAVNEALNGRR